MIIDKVIAILFAGSLLAVAQDPTPDFGWQAVARMSDARVDHCAVSLGDGRVLVVGGTSSKGGLLDTAEIYGPDDSFRQAASMSAARMQHSCTLLADGRVLVAGGATRASAELFDPLSGGWTTVDGMMMRRGQTATTISGGRVLLAGGWANSQPTAALEIYDPEAERISTLPATLATPRFRHTATLLSDGRVLFIGGSDGVNSLDSAEIYDPASGTVSPASSLLQARAGHITATLMDRRILVAGGANGKTELATAEIYSESTKQFSLLNAALTIPRQDAFAIVIPGNGLVLIGGGEGGGQALPDTELFDAGSNQFIVGGALTAARTRIQGAVLADGVILGAGGQNADGPSNACGVFAAPRLTFTKTQYAGGETAVVNGSGFRAIAGRGVSLTLTATGPDGSVKSVSPPRLLTSVVMPDSSGAFQADILTVAADDSNTTFTLKTFVQALIGDGSSNTIQPAGQPTASFTVPDLADTILTVDPVPTRTVAGVTIPFSVTFNSSRTVPFNGLLTILIGNTTKNFNVANLIPGTKVTFNFCCLTLASRNAVSVSYALDPGHAPARVTLPNLFVVDKTLQISTTTSLRLFQQVDFTVTAALGGPILAPVPTGTLTLTRQLIGGASQTASLIPLKSFDVGGGAVFPIRATFAEKPNACYTVAYSGDGFYPPQSETRCVPTLPAIPQLQITAANNYTFSTDYPLQLKLTFPNELGMVNKTVHLSPLGIDVTLTPAVGSATASTTLALPFGSSGFTATYDGGGDIAGASLGLAFSMNLVPSTTILAPIPSPTGNPISLSANVIPNAGRGANVPVQPTGIVQFFDGSLFLGQASLVAQSNSGHAVLNGVARPVGNRSFKAVYLGSSLFAGSSSQAQTVTIQ